MSAAPPYRELAAVVSSALQELEYRGPRIQCPVCGSDKTWGWDGDSRRVIDSGRACRGRWRWWRPWGCKRKDLHLHQKCHACGARWECAPIEATE